jgi:hypothetical protein
MNKMLVIGFVSKENMHFSRDLNVDPDIDSPRKIHDALLAAAKSSGWKGFDTILCIQDDTVIASFCDEDDYDLEEDAEDDKTADDDDAYDDDQLSKDGEDDEDAEIDDADIEGVELEE